MAQQGREARVRAGGGGVNRSRAKQREVRREQEGPEKQRTRCGGFPTAAPKVLARRQCRFQETGSPLNLKFHFPFSKMHDLD